MYAFHEELTGFIDASVARIFAALDDPTRLSSHMNKRSWQMTWGTMETLSDAQLGQPVGSHLIMRGRVLGISLHLDEVVTSREPPFRKQWETVGTSQLLVIGPYRMAFELTSKDTGSSLRVTLDYDLHQGGKRAGPGLVVRAQLCEMVHAANGARRSTRDIGPRRYTSGDLNALRSR